VAKQEQLRGGEEVVLDLRPHWWFFWRQVAALVAALALGIVLLAVGPNQSWSYLVPAIFLVVAVGWFGLRYAVWATTNFIITTDRIISRKGVLSRSGIEIPLERVNTVFFSQSLFERMLRAGDLVIESAGEMGSSKFTDIRRPLDVQNEIYHQMEDNENRKFDRVGQNIAAPASIPDQIDKLDELRRRGVLTDAEFNAKKTDLLRRL
jgi:uncharacterized membrane protein YdbT with pleckstrin-like domain